MLLLTQLTPTSSYGTGVLPALLVIGVGMGCIFAPAFSAATLGVAPNEAGIASAMVNTSQQIGGSIGTSLLSTIYASAVASYLDQPCPRQRPCPLRAGPRRHDGVLVGRRDLRPGIRARAGDRARPVRGAHGDDPNRSGPTRDRQLRPGRGRGRRGRHRQPRAPQSRSWRRRTTPSPSAQLENHDHPARAAHLGGGDPAARGGDPGESYRSKASGTHRAGPVAPRTCVRHD